MNKLLLKVSTTLVTILRKLAPDNMHLKMFQEYYGGDFIKTSDQSMVLDSITILENDKALLTYKFGKDKFFTYTINYRIGKTKSLNIYEKRSL